MRNAVLIALFISFVCVSSPNLLWGAPETPSRSTAATTPSAPKAPKQATPKKSSTTKVAAKKAPAKKTTSKKSPAKKASPPKAAPPATRSPAQAGITPAAVETPRSGLDLGSLTDVTGADSKEPTLITADTLTLDATKRIFTYKGNVTVKQGAMTLTCGEIVGRYDAQNRIETIDARKDVVITKDDIRGTSQKALFTARTNTVTLTENPEVHQQGSALSADSITIFLDENRSVAEGTVRVKLVQKGAAATPPIEF